jgi:hypothetical protein
MRMLEDGNGNSMIRASMVSDDPGVMPFSGAGSAKTYRRVYRLQSVAAPENTADTIATTAAVWDPPTADVERAGRSAVLEPDRYNIAKQGCLGGGREWKQRRRWCMISCAEFADANRCECDKPRSDLGPSHRSSIRVTRRAWQLRNLRAVRGGFQYSLGSAPLGTVVVTPAANTRASPIRRAVRTTRRPDSASTSGVGIVDRPLDFALADARARSVGDAMTADSAANRTSQYDRRPITGGKDGGDAPQCRAQYRDDGDVVHVGDGERRDSVCDCVHRGQAAAADVASLQAIATNSGGLPVPPRRSRCHGRRPRRSRRFVERVRHQF